MFNMFSGGALSRFSLFALNVVPYISASIVVQLMCADLAQLKAMSKEGESGRRKITQYSRFGAVFLAIFQAAGIAIALQSQGAGSGLPVVYSPGPGFVLTAVVSLTAGTMFLMWLGEQITERGIGNGISLIIFAGIVAGLPGAVLNTLQQANSGDMQWITVFFILAIVLAFTWFVVFVERGQRRITVNYARRQGGRGAYMNQSSFLPLKLNMAGVIPPIFASRLTAAGALYLVLVCLLPEVMRTELGTSFYFGGTSLLIVVVVVMDFIAQIQAHLMSSPVREPVEEGESEGWLAGPLTKRTPSRASRPGRHNGRPGGGLAHGWH
jgi:preprotein translocase subunit SecY